MLVRRTALLSLGILAAPMMALPAAAAVDDPQSSKAQTAAVEEKATSSVVVIGTVEKPGEPVKITDKKHPDYVSCRSEAVLGSRAQRKRVCMTNREWTAAARSGNRETQEFMNAGRYTQPTP